MSNAFDNLASTLITYNNTTHNVGDELLYFASPESDSTFTIDFHRPIYRPDFEIYKNGVLVHTSASVTTSNENPCVTFHCNIPCLVDTRVKTYLRHKF